MPTRRLPRTTGTAVCKWPGIIKFAASRTVVSGVAIVTFRIIASTTRFAPSASRPFNVSVVTIPTTLPCSTTTRWWMFFNFRRRSAVAIDADGEMTSTGVVMVGAGVEMVAGGLNDPLLGPVIMAGTGGIFVELVGDTAFRMCPLTEPDAVSLIEELKGKVLLRGYRGAPVADESAFVTLLLALSQLLDVSPEIEEMDLNPVMVLRKGAVVVDARIKIGALKPAARSRRIAY